MCQAAYAQQVLNGSERLRMQCPIVRLPRCEYSGSEWTVVPVSLCMSSDFSCTLDSDEVEHEIRSIVQDIPIKNVHSFPNLKMDINSDDIEHLVPINGHAFRLEMYTHSEA